MTVITPEAALLDVADVAWVQLHLAGGSSVGIYPGHAPLLAETQPGALRYATTAGGEETVALEAGILQVLRGRVTVFTSGRLDAPRTLPADGTGHFDRLAKALLAGLGAEPSAVQEG